MVVTVSLLQSLAEKGGSVLENVTAHENFFVLATMNPGGDYGKKELSPALRNRFTEIWVPSVSDMEELRNIALQRYVYFGNMFIETVYLCSCMILIYLLPFSQNCQPGGFIFGGSYAKFLGGGFCFPHFCAIIYLMLSTFMRILEKELSHKYLASFSCNILSYNRCIY